MDLKKCKELPSIPFFRISIHFSPHQRKLLIFSLLYLGSLDFTPWKCGTFRKRSAWVRKRSILLDCFLGTSNKI